jgi:hypothetical protein
VAHGLGQSHAPAGRAPLGGRCGRDRLSVGKRLQHRLSPRGRQPAQSLRSHHNRLTVSQPQGAARVQAPRRFAGSAAGLHRRLPVFVRLSGRRPFRRHSSAVNHRPPGYSRATPVMMIKIGDCFWFTETVQVGGRTGDHHRCLGFVPAWEAEGIGLLKPII